MNSLTDLLIIRAEIFYLDGLSILMKHANDIIKNPRQDDSLSSSIHQGSKVTLYLDPHPVALVTCTRSVDLIVILLLVLLEREITT